MLGLLLWPFIGSVYVFCFTLCCSFLPVIIANDVFPSDCGRSGKTSRIVSGTVAQHGAYPWMAVIFRMEHVRKRQHCAGSLITNAHILSAAHCYTGEDKYIFPGDIIVHLGEYDLNEIALSRNEQQLQLTTRVILGISKIATHPHFNNTTFLNDIAILTLEKRIEFGEFIRPVCLPSGAVARTNFVDKKAMIVGWGRTKWLGPTSRYPMEAVVHIWSYLRCRKPIMNQFHISITREYICAGDEGGGKVDACEGDSGGPLLWKKRSDQGSVRWYQIGIVSFGHGCATPNFPGIYTRVSMYIDWITEKVSSK